MRPSLTSRPASRRALRRLAAALALLAPALPAEAQQSQASGQTPSNWNMPFDANQDQKGFPVGPFFLYPYLRIDSVGLDTNVFYTAADRQTDFVASGGPGLTISLPLRPWRFVLDGGLGYHFFARTEAQRRLAGSGLGRAEYSTSVVKAGVERSFQRSWGRTLEIDQRTLQDQWRTSVFFALGSDDARLQVLPRFDDTRTRLLDQPLYYGNNLARNLDRNEQRFWLGLQLKLTAKTSLLAEGDYQTDRFPGALARDVDSYRAGGGFSLESQTRLTGRALGGLRYFRPKTSSFKGDRQRPYAQVDLGWRFGPKTQLLAGYARDAQFSGFDGANVYYTQDVPLGLQRRITRKIDIRLNGRYRTLETPGPVVVAQPGKREVGIRNDRYWEGGADLGYTIKQRFRIGGTLTYAQRLSRFSDFGINGLLFGATIRYNPPQIY